MEIFVLENQGKSKVIYATQQKPTLYFLSRENGDEPSKFGIVPYFVTTQNLDRHVLAYPWEVWFGSSGLGLEKSPTELWLNKNPNN